MRFFNRRRNVPVQQPVQQKPVQPKRDNDNCEIKVKRDKSGKIIGMTSKGKCTKEDRAIFSRENGLVESSEVE